MARVDDGPPASRTRWYTHFDELCEIMRAYDVTFSLGDGLRPGCLADANDEAQFAELKTLGELTLKAWEHGCQVMIEGPGHIPMHLVKMNVEKERECATRRPFYVLGPAGDRHRAGLRPHHLRHRRRPGRRGGAAMLCYVTPKEHLGLPNKDDVRQGVIAYKIAAHAGDIARGRKNARERDDELSQGPLRVRLERAVRAVARPGDGPGDARRDAAAGGVQVGASSARCAGRSSARCASRRTSASSPPRPPRSSRSANPRPSGPAPDPSHRRAAPLGLDEATPWAAGVSPANPWPPTAFHRPDEDFPTG